MLHQGTIDGFNSFGTYVMSNNVSSKVYHLFTSYCRSISRIHKHSNINDNALNINYMNSTHRYCSDNCKVQ